MPRRRYTAGLAAREQAAMAILSMDAYLHPDTPTFSYVFLGSLLLLLLDGKGVRVGCGDYVGLCLCSCSLYGLLVYGYVVGYV